jgi:hypothetical protein
MHFLTCFGAPPAHLEFLQSGANDPRDLFVLKEGNQRSCWLKIFFRVLIKKLKGFN